MNDPLPKPNYLQDGPEQARHPLLQFCRDFFSRFDLIQIIPMLALLALGALFIYGTGQQVGGIHAEIFWKRQLLYMCVGLTVWFSLIFIDYRWLGPSVCIFYPLTLFLLVYVLFAGEVRFNARRWIDFFGTSIQPSEFGKLAVILSVAWVLSFKRADINRPLWALLVALLTGIPFVLIAKEPDLGTSLVLLPITFAIAFTAKLKWRYLLILLLAVLCIAPLAYLSLHTYQKERILTFLDPERDPLNRGWNAIQAGIAVGSGGVSGKGFMEGTHCTLGYLPKTVANSDFIFPVIAEETGFIGTCLILLLYAFLLLSILRTALLAPDEFGRYLCVGVAALLVMHIFVNIGMCIKIAPVTGLPLPLVSYGGTFMVVTLTYLGIVQSVYAHREKQSFLDV